MDKEEAMKILKGFHDKSALFSVRTALETLHPELKESEDERIRKTLIRFFKDQYSNETEMYDGSVTVGKALAWLEKQGEHKFIWDENDDWIRTKIIKVLLDSELTPEETNECIFWLKKQGEQKQHDIDVLERHITKDSISELAHTVIVRNGWEIVDAKEQNPAWSEEDENYLNTTIAYLKDANEFKKTAEKCITWLKSLRTKNHWKPSDGQITVLELASKYERFFTPNQIDILIDLKEQLKKLKVE